MAIHYETIDVQVPKMRRREISNWIKDIIARHQKEMGGIVYIFCSDTEILRINQEYLKHDYYTDIITFDYSEEKVISGDIFISLDTVKSNADQFSTDYSEELYRVMAHGVLHLCGFKDKTPEEKALMRTEENEALSRLLIISNPSAK